MELVHITFGTLLLPVLSALLVLTEQLVPLVRLVLPEQLDLLVLMVQPVPPELPDLLVLLDQLA